MTCHYQIVKYHNEEYVWYELHRVHLDAEGKVLGWTEESLLPDPYDSAQELIEDMGRMYFGAQKFPVTTEEELKKDSKK